ncbi:hypothetical protein JTB14_035998 [Gonioctena quinquepunctata]|nr:hypothetical protein JTB14_035998 [Gonioctena quinquepunctata]
MQIEEIGKLFGNAYKKAATAEIAAKGSEEVGLFPCNRHKFRPNDYLDSNVEQPVSNPLTEGQQEAPLLITGSPYKQHLEESQKEKPTPKSVFRKKANASTKAVSVNANKSKKGQRL